MTQDYDRLIAAAEQREAKAKARSESLRRIATAEAEIPSLMRTGEVSQNALVQKYGIAAVTVKRILRDAGIPVTRVRKLKDEDRAQVVAMLRANESILMLAKEYGVSQNTIRRIGMETGVLEKGKRKPRRSDAEYELIGEFDNELRQRFGQGLYNLGIGYKAYLQRKKAKAENAAKLEPSEPQPVDGDGNLIPTPDQVPWPPTPDTQDQVQQWVPKTAPEDPDTQLGGNDAPWPEPTDPEPLPPVEEDDTPFQAPTVEPSEDENDGSPEPSRLTTDDFAGGFKAPGEPNF